MRVAAFTLVLAVALPASAGAATWTEPELVASHLSAPTCCQDFGFSTAGNALAVLTTQSTESHTSGALTSTRFITRAASGEWSEVVEGPGYPRTFRAQEQRVTTDGEVLLFGTPARFKPYRDRPTGLAVRHGRLTASGVTFDSTEVLRKKAVKAYDFAANAEGDAVVAWGVREGKHRGVFVRRSYDAGEFGEVKRLTRRAPGYGSVLAEVGRGGHTVVTWSRHGKVLARVAGPGRAFRPRIGLGPSGAYSALAVGPVGQVLLARVRPPIGEAKLFATRSGPSGSGGKTDVLAGPAKNLYNAPPVVTFDRAARGLVAWTDTQAHVATLTGGDPQIEPLEPDGLVNDIAVGPDRRVAILLGTAAGAGYVALRGPSGPFAPGERVTPDGVGPGGSIAFNFLTGEPVVLYLTNVVSGEPIDDAYVVERQPG